MSSTAPRGTGRPVWFRSSYSNGAGGECVECALGDDSALVRDSKSTEKSAITVGGDAWRFFLQHITQTRHPRL
ncbi:DUF397 domain-containing protein [Streptomyces sp. NPDC020490]|uniref:DUF397 domain-containing protein n=1 Tax=Streptomyces sp. NPDC020490 TaxID=3365078 RepID=UPI0037B5C7D7